LSNDVALNLTPVSVHRSGPNMIKQHNRKAFLLNEIQPLAAG
jgi:hypothetical protein